MAQSYTLTGAHIQVYVNNKILKECQGLQFEIDYGEQRIVGIDSPDAQEIAITTINVSGSLTLIRQKNSGGIQSQNMRPLLGDMAAAPYISIRVHDRQSGEDIAFFPYAKIAKEGHTINMKSVYRISLNFTATIPVMAQDRV